MDPDTPPSEGHFRVGLTEDLRPLEDLPAAGLEALSERADIAWDYIPDSRTGSLGAEQLADYDAILLLRPRITAESIANATRLALIARWGVGLDNVDIEACTAAGIAINITPDGVRRPVASAALALILAFAHRLPQKDRQARGGEWSERFETLGRGLTGRTLGVVGLGRIGRELLALSAPLGMTALASDPHVSADQAAAAGARLVELDRLLEQSDFVVLTCALTPETYHLIGREGLVRMKRDAVLVNVARGAIVDQAALVDALERGVIAGAALDTLDPEPPAPDERILELDNVILAPHSLAWTDELARGNTRGCCEAIIALAEGRLPAHLVNPEAVRSAAFANKPLGRALSASIASEASA